MSADAEGGFRDATVCIVGLGLMGGSLAMALRGKVARITAQDANPAVIESALAASVIDAEGAPAEADIIVLATPAHVILDLIPALGVRVAQRRLRKAPGALVIDLGSTKGRICEALDGLPEGVLAVGGHPMCGLAENGYANATPGLYAGARFVLCETARTTPRARALAEGLVRAVGAQPLWMERRRHDCLTALTSHVPHLLSFALMRLAEEVDREEAGLYELAAGGFDGATRLARTDETMIVGMFSTNAEQIRRMAARLRAELDRLDAILDDPQALAADLAEIVEARRAYSDRYGERPIA